MTIRPIIVLAFKIQCVLAVVLATYPFLPFLAYLTLPLTFPAVFVLGDESTERFGVVCELTLVWVLAIPMALLYAGIHCRWSHRKTNDRDIRNDNGA